MKIMKRKDDDMNTNNDHLADDYLWHSYPNGMTGGDIFFEHVLPWLILLSVPLAILFLSGQFFVVLVVVSGWLRSVLNVIGL